MTIFISAIFLSAFLLFSIQPILGKFLLPYLGGSPAVWITTMMVYQGLLLGGYAYAHLLRSRVGGRMHIRVHVGLLTASLFTMPIAPVTQVWVDPMIQPTLWLVLTLLATVGLPFFILSANAPLIQSWFAVSGHPHAADPYFLYSASNLGSFLALVSYPFLTERLLGLSDQLTAWSWGYGLFGGIIGIIGIQLLRRRPGEIPPAALPATNGDNTAGHSPTLTDRLHWLALAFVPSSLLLGVTFYLTTDIAAFPLLWVIPLALYLLTFVVAFSHLNELVLKNTLHLQLFLQLAALFTLAVGWTGPRVFVLHITAFAVTVYVCHGRLAALRPQSRYLTEFYLWIALGGVMGGLFNAVAAPYLFTDVWEYPIALLAAALLRPAMQATIGRAARSAWPGWPASARAVALGLAAFGIFRLGASYGVQSDHFKAAMYAVFLILFGLMFIFARKRPLRLFAMMAAVLLTAGSSGDGETLLKERNFFGTLTVQHNKSNNTHTLVHGTTIHGLQSLDPEYRLAPTSYYRPLGEIFSLVEQSLGTPPVALVGLGAGIVTCLGRRGHSYDIFEINPAVVRVARNPSFFSYLSECRSKEDMNIILGDARLSMAEVEDGKYGLIVLDAYNSDALPVHLLTREAMALYLKKLRPGGLIALHISNAHLDLRPVVQALAQNLKLELAFSADDGEGELHFPSHWIILSRSDAAPLMARLSEKWRSLPETPAPVWTDDYSNIVGSLK